MMGREMCGFYFSISPVLFVDELGASIMATKSLFDRGAHGHEIHVIQAWFNAA
jgi:hypothetical protein